MSCQVALNTLSSRRPVTVSSMSSLESSTSAHDTAQEQVSLPETSNNIVSSSTLDSMIQSPPHTNSAVPDKETSSSNLPVASASFGPSGMLLSAPVPIVSRPAAAIQVHAPANNNHAVAEFIFQLTKMLTDDNRDVIEWTNGQINVHDPHKLASDVLHKYFRHSKFASFQRQLNYFGFRKLAGKGKMAPCSYTNEAATSDLRSLLLIKRKASATTPEDNKPRKRVRSESVPRTAKSTTVPVNPVLAGILQRNSTSPLGKQPKTVSASASSAQLALGKGIKHGFIKTHPGMPSSTSHQALARAAVGKGVRHGFSVPSSALSSATMAFPDPPSLSLPDIEDSLSELTNNYRNSLQNAVMTAEETKDEGNESDPSFNMYHFLRRDSSLVDLAMLVSNVEPENMGSVEPTPVNEMRNSTMSFVDFSHQDFDPSINNDEFED